MKLTPLLGFIGRSVIGGLAIAFVVIYLWPGLAEHIRQPQTVTPMPAAPTSAPFSYAEAVDRAAPAVVSVYTRRVTQAINVPSSGGSRSLYQMRQDMGSGVLLSEDGYILTNHHVISNVQNVRVELWDGRIAQAAIIGTDPETDLAVLKVDLQGLPFAQVSIGAELRVGDVVLAIGNALGLSHTVTMGIVSATGRNVLNSEIYNDFIQTDAAINTGNSGGALVNANGELIGINTRKSASTGAQNIGFAIPITLARNIMEEIIESGSVRRGWLGATFTDLRPMSQPDGNTSRNGIGVQEVYRGGPAWNAGIRQGDIILSLNGEDIVESSQFLLQIAQSEPGAEVELEVYRRPETFSTYATLIQQPPLP